VIADGHYSAQAVGHGGRLLRRIAVSGGSARSGVQLVEATSGWGGPLNRAFIFLKNALEQIQVRLKAVLEELIVGRGECCSDVEVRVNR